MNEVSRVRVDAGGPGPPAGSVAVLPAALAVLFIIGQAVTLQLIRAGNAVGYQHWLPPGEMVAPAARGYLLFVVGQAAVLLAVWLRCRATGRLQAPGLRPGPRALLVMAGFVLAGAALSKEPAVYATELVVAALIQGVQLANLALAVLLVPAGRLGVWSGRLARLAGDAPRSANRASGPAAAGLPAPDDCDPERLRVGRFALLAAAWTTAVSAGLAWFVYQAHPHIPDEVSFLMQARYFAAGLLAMESPPVPAAFNLDLMTYEAGRWYSPLTPAWPAVLAIGVRLGAPWLVNPVLTGIATILTWLFVGELYGRRMARLTTLLLCVSPWFLYMGANLMNHQWTLVAALTAALGVARARRPGAGRWPWLIAAGVALGVLAMLRPLEGLCMAVLLGLWALASAPGRGVRRLGPVLVLAAVSIPVSAVQLAYNRFLTGSATAFPVMEYLHAEYGEGSNALGFGPDRGFGWTGLDPLPGHGAADVAINTALNTFLINVELLGWGFGSLLPFFILIGFGPTRPEDRIMVAAVFGVILAHAFYWFSGGPDFGARYWYLVLVPALVLTVRGIEVVGGRLEGRHGAGGMTRAFLGAALLSASAMLTFMPWRAVDKYFHYRNMRPDIRTLAADHHFGSDLVLIRGRRHPDYASAAVYNPINLHDQLPIYAWDREDADVLPQLLRSWPDRNVWVIDGPTRSGDGFRIVAGPVPASRFLREAPPRD